MWKQAVLTDLSYFPGGEAVSNVQFRTNALAHKKKLTSDSIGEKDTSKTLWNSPESKRLSRQSKKTETRRAAAA